MIDLQPIIEQFKKAIYGRDVRQGIVDIAKTINSTYREQETLRSEVAKNAKATEEHAKSAKATIEEQTSASVKSIESATSKASITMASLDKSTTAGLEAKGSLDRSIVAGQASENAISEYVKDVHTIIDRGGVATEKYVSDKIKAIKKVTIEVVDTLPSTGQENIIYFLQRARSSGNSYDEYAWVRGKWELVGSKDIDLTPYATKELLNSNMNKVQSTIAQSFDLGSYDAPPGFKKMQEAIPSWTYIPKTVSDATDVLAYRVLAIRRSADDMASKDDISDMDSKISGLEDKVSAVAGNSIRSGSYNAPPGFKKMKEDISAWYYMPSTISDATDILAYRLLDVRKTCDKKVSKSEFDNLISEETLKAFESLGWSRPEGGTS